MDVKPTDRRDTGSCLPNQGPAKRVPPDQPAGGWGAGLTQVQGSEVRRLS